jgi:broad specificity phosphatase PhoE
VTLFVVRHGRTAQNASGRLQGRADHPLDEVGLEQARRLAAAIGPVARIVSSPLQRARQTAAAWAAPVELDERWIELDYGELEGLPLRDVPLTTWQAWRRDAGFRPPGGETLDEVLGRVSAAAEELLAEAAERDVVVVTHVSPVKAAVAWALGVGMATSWRCQIDTASITRIGRGAAGPSLRGLNDTGHL